MSPRRVPSTKDVAASLNQAIPRVAETPARRTQVHAATPAPEPAQPAAAPDAAPPTPVTWQKSTIPFRADQHEAIERILAKFRSENGFQLTLAEVLRLGLDKMIAALNDEGQRDGLLAELFEQQRRESAGNEKLKHSRSRGLGRYLAERRKGVS